MSWEPQQAGLVQLAALLEEFQKPGTNQSQALQQLEQYKHVPDFNNYLAYIFARGEQLPVEVRQSAGLLLKNNLKQQYVAASEEYKRYIKDALLLVLPSPSRPLRQTAGTIASEIVGAAGLGAWTELVGTIANCLQSGSVDVLDGGLDTLYKIIEDHPSQMEVQLSAVPGTSATASSTLCGLLLKLMQSPHVDIRRQSVACLNLLAKDMPAGLLDSLDAYLQGLFALAHDTAAGVRREVCIGLVQMLNVQPDRLAPFLYQIIEYMLASNEHDDEGVALESCEFWMSFCEARLDAELLRPFLPRLIPMLMKNMVYDEYDEEVHDAEAAESPASRREEKDSEIKPFLHKQRDHNAQVDEAEDEEEESLARWNLRKCSAAGLDRLSIVYGDELLPVLLPIVEQRLQDPDWRARESAILALGAVSEGCHTGLLPYLAGMISMLLPKLSDPRPMVRIISCWALSRYSHWLLTGTHPTLDATGQPAGQSAAGHAALPSVVQGLLTCVLDHNKFVQEAACSALAQLEETAGNEECPQLLEPFLKPILETLGMAGARYTRRNLRLVYDALGTLAEAVGKRIADPALVPLYMSPLYQRFLALQPTDKDLLPLMECFITLAIMLGRAFEPFAAAVFEKSMRVLQIQFEALHAAAMGQPSAIEYDRMAVVCALDLISGMAEGLGPSIEPLVASSALVQVLVQTSKDETAEVRQSSYALLGDLSRACISHITPVVPDLVASALRSLEGPMLTQENMRSCNNACWALGEMAIKLQPEVLSAYAERIAERVAGILLFTTRLPRSIIENSAITLGRVAWVCPEQVAPHLGHFCAQWCQALRNIRDDVEKEHAFLGLCRLARLNPQAAAAAFTHICAAVVSWRRISCDGLRNEITQIMQVFKQHFTASGSWQQVMSALDVPIQQKLVQMCQL
mmetsp:Transcript_21721/g.47478  ORF Transcript_21721/g.47478 Transcript_21721/m.47478 type:complete len:916 (+) Transcript_21721:105-2852(+)|eukprot:CAMPEP_0202894064 /NCGR_PEP_ID=MMETSP1392-20130828/3517_1 /ASSEMBLY_ACC=CAM_ASM_000868 /TAXON_ID=225041 /ORGANISM="Chlamydomonas chlamydogama, Strain SAG 11-48b" /LENGTH=915 /DNA_ID=CAMNT_0049578615 /DNA_START=44 /DNA_END=2791 /DNA_ORIENTATION=+